MSKQDLMDSVLSMQMIEDKNGTGLEPQPQAISPLSVAFCFTPLPISSISAAFCN